MTPEGLVFLVRWLFEESYPVIDPLGARAAADQWIRLTEDLCSCAGVGPADGRFGESSPNGVEEDIAHGRHEMGLVHWKGGEAFLPEVPGPPMPAVDLEGVSVVRLTQRPGQPLLVRRYDDEVHVVGHQAVGPDAQSVPMGLISQDPSVETIVVFREEDLHSPCTALRNVMWHAGYHYAR